MGKVAYPIFFFLNLSLPCWPFVFYYCVQRCFYFLSSVFFFWRGDSYNHWSFWLSDLFFYLSRRNGCLYRLLSRDTNPLSQIIQTSYLKTLTIHVTTSLPLFSYSICPVKSVSHIPVDVASVWNIQSSQWNNLFNWHVPLTWVFNEDDRFVLPPTLPEAAFQFILQKQLYLHLFSAISGCTHSREPAVIADSLYQWYSCLKTIPSI